MSWYPWPEYWFPASYSLRLLPNIRSYDAAYAPNTDVIDLLGERWLAMVTMFPQEDPVEVAAMEAFFDRLKGQSHGITMSHQKLAVPQGTMRGSPTLSASAAQLANTMAITGGTASSTLRAGDMLSVQGQLIRVMADVALNGSGAGTVEFQGRVRAAAGWPSGSAVTYVRPTANFLLRNTDGVPIVWNPGFAEGASFELIESL